jgi:hypothetical protein
MKQFILLSLAAFLMMSCTVNSAYHTYGEADPVVTSHGIIEDVVGYETIQVDTVFPYPGRRALERMPLDEVTCSYGECLGSYTTTVELVEFNYDITVANDGEEPAYGLLAALRTRIETWDPYEPNSTLVTFQTVDLYMADILEPGWQVTISYALDDNEEVLEFMVIHWDDWDTYAGKLRDNENHYKGLAKTGASPKITVTKIKKD